MAGRLGPWLLGIAVASAAVYALWVQGVGAPDPIGRGSRAPGFSLPRLSDGEPVRLSDLRGHVVLLNFWATWCKPCEEEMPAMEHLHRALGSQGLALLAVAVDDDPEAVRRFRDRLGLSFPILLDPDERVAREYQTFRYPESLLIGSDGVVVERYVGGKEWDAPAYVERIRRLLASPVPSDSA